MFSSLYVAKTGLDAQQMRLSTISNNLANVNTTAYKRDRAIFEDLLYQNVRQPGASSSQDTQLPSGLSLGTGVRIVATEKLFTQGNFTQTNNSLDLAIEGRGFFEVLLPNGNTAYTRDGSFQIDSQGQMVNSSGYPVQPAITLPSSTSAITIGEDGTVTASIPGSSTPTQVGNIQLVDFINPTGLQAVGGNLYTETASSGAPQAGNPGLNGLGNLIQGAIETSNVNVVEELVGMIEAQRGYEMNAKAIETSDSMLQYLNNNI